jgi:sugar phosphate isomerase/epimerase
MHLAPRFAAAVIAAFLDLGAHVKLVLHSYSFRSYPLHHFLLAARQFGWTAVELSTCHFDRAERDLPAVVQLARRCGVEIYCAGYNGDFLADDESVQNRSILSIKETIDASADNGIQLVNGFGGWLDNGSDDWRQNGSALAHPEDYERVAAIYRMLGDYAHNRGVRVSIEVHPNTIHDTVPATAHLLDLIDNRSVVATPDPGNSFIISAAERDPSVLNCLNGRFCYFHLKNCLPGDRRADFNVGTGEGVIDNYKWLARLAEFDIPAICVEYCGDGDPHPHIAAAPAYIQSSLRFAETVRCTRLSSIPATR